MNWMSQINPSANGECFVCKRGIPSGLRYYRAVVDADSPDGDGYDCCEVCRKALPSTPPTKFVFKP